MHPDHLSYNHFTGPAQLHRALNSLAGIIEGISIDGEINVDERRFLGNWIQDHLHQRHQHPFNELMPVLDQALGEGRMDEESAEDLRWLIDRMRSTERANATTADLQRLHAVLEESLPTDAFPNGSCAASPNGWMSMRIFRGAGPMTKLATSLRRCWLMAW